MLNTLSWEPCLVSEKAKRPLLPSLVLSKAVSCGAKDTAFENELQD